MGPCKKCLRSKSFQDGSLCQLFEVVKLKQMYGKEYLGIERSTFLIDSNGILQHEWRKVRIKGHVEDVLQAAQMIDTQSQQKTRDEEE